MAIFNGKIHYKLPFSIAMLVCHVQKTMENGIFLLVYLLNIVIFHSYGLPEGNGLIVVDLMEMNGVSCDFNGVC